MLHFEDLQKALGLVKEYEMHSLGSFLEKKDSLPKGLQQTIFYFPGTLQMQVLPYYLPVEFETDPETGGIISYQQKLFEDPLVKYDLCSLNDGQVVLENVRILNGLEDTLVDDFLKSGTKGLSPIVRSVNGLFVQYLENGNCQIIDENYFSKPNSPSSVIKSFSNIFGEKVFV